MAGRQYKNLLARLCGDRISSRQSTHARQIDQLSLAGVDEPRRWTSIRITLTGGVLAHRRRTIDVWVSKRVLGIADTRISLEKITQVGVERAPSELGRALSFFVSRVIFTAIVAVIATFIIGLVKRSSQHHRESQTTLSAALSSAFTSARPFYLIIGAFALIPILFATNKIRREIANQYLFVLYIATGGPLLGVVRSFGRAKLREVCDLIAKAIDDPAMEFRIQIANAYFGDSITQIGDNNTGKR